MTDVSETISEELSKAEAREAPGTSEEGLSPEVKAKMEAGRERVHEATEALKLEQAGNEALGEPIPGDVAGEGVEEAIEETKP